MTGTKIRRASETERQDASVAELQRNIAAEVATDRRAAVAEQLARLKPAIEKEARAVAVNGNGVLDRVMKGTKRGPSV